MKQRLLLLVSMLNCTIGKTAEVILARDWIAEIYQEVWAIAKQQGFSCFLSPLQKILREGNEAQQWLQLHAVGFDTQRVITQAIIATLDREIELEDKLCSSLAA